MTFTGGANTLTLQSGSNVVGNIDVTGSLTFSQSTDATLSNVISGTGSISKTGAATLTLSGANTYSGGTAINAGTLAVAADNNLGNAAGGLSFDGGTLQFLAGFTINRAITLNAGGGTFDTNGNDATLAGTIGGSGGLTKTGLGTLTLLGANSYARAARPSMPAPWCSATPLTRRQSSAPSSTATFCNSSTRIRAGSPCSPTTSSPPF